MRTMVLCDRSKIPLKNGHLPKNGIFCMFKQCAHMLALLPSIYVKNPPKIARNFTVVPLTGLVGTLGSEGRTVMTSSPQKNSRRYWFKA